jgi:soluble lytic murein transglycosylase-like protein
MGNRRSRLTEPERSKEAAGPPQDDSRWPLDTLLFQWETRHLSPLRRGLLGWWRRSRRLAAAATVGAALFVLGASFAVAPEEMSPPTAVLEQRLHRAEDALAARSGELELARLELNRMNAIVQHSAEHRIPADLASTIYDVAIAEGVDPTLAFSLVRVESGFTRRAVSSAGAVGLTQVMPSTALWLQPGLTYNELFEPHTNLRLGFRYLRLMLEQYNGDLHLALLAYNRGPNRVDDILRGGGDPSNGYAGMVRSAMRRPSE